MHSLVSSSNKHLLRAHNAPGSLLEAGDTETGNSSVFKLRKSNLSQLTQKQYARMRGQVCRLPEVPVPSTPPSSEPGPSVDMGSELIENEREEVRPGEMRVSSHRQVPLP